MKCFGYEYAIEWGVGQGIVPAESEGRARELLTAPENTYEGHNQPLPGLNVWEIDITAEQVLSFGWNI